MEPSNEVKTRFFPYGCNICRSSVDTLKVVDEEEIYNRRYSDKDKKYWKCFKCESYVGCHDEGISPLGILADKELRGMKMDVHKLFDPIWKYYVEVKGMVKNKARNKAYQWLADEMELNKKECHVGYFDKDQCREALRVLNRTYANSISLRNFKKTIRP